jgi:EAL domain-containing protein (putative c-di-GMP-specific phosphodiesterase class I)
MFVSVSRETSSRNGEPSFKPAPEVREAEQKQREQEKLELVGHLQEALEQERFVLYAQPIVDLKSGEVVQRELLIRMTYREKDGVTPGLTSPGRFLPVAEEYGIITEIDRWVVSRAAGLAAAGAPVQVNVSSRSVIDPEFVAHIRAALERTQASPRALVFEITETALVEHEAAGSRFVQQLHELGCRTAVDDFGTGYGAFQHLKQLPIDFLKIDREFVRDLPRSAPSRNIVSAVVRLAKGFGQKTIAEGVEDEETMPFLRELGVDFAQGFHLGRPTPI